MLFSASFLVVLIAVINFINFTMALVPARIKSINIRKILGDSVWRLRGFLWLESFLFALLSYAISLLLLLVYEGCIGGGFHMKGIVFWGGLFMALCAGLLAGAYPAIYATYSSANRAEWFFRFVSKGKKNAGMSGWFSVYGFNYIDRPVTVYL